MKQKEYKNAIAGCDALLDLNQNPRFAQHNKREAMKAAGMLAAESKGSENFDGSMPAPKLLSPPPGAVFSDFPRHTALTWEKVPGAVAYEVETDYHYANTWASDDGRSAPAARTATNTYEFDFVGAQPGRWRVWAIGEGGAPGAKSEWREFRYTR